MAEEESKLSLEEKFASLEEVIKRLESEDIPLEEAFKAYNQGMRLVAQCNDQIDRVEKQVLKLSEDGRLEEFSYESGRI